MNQNGNLVDGDSSRSVNNSLSPHTQLSIDCPTIVQMPSFTLFTDAKIVKKILLCVDNIDTLHTVQALNKRFFAVTKSTSFRFSWLLRHKELLQKWILNFRKKPKSTGYQDWIAKQLYHTPSHPFIVDTLLNDQLLVSKLIEHFLDNDTDIAVDLWEYLTSFRSLVSMSLALEKAQLFQRLVKSPAVAENLVYSCILTPLQSDGERGLAVLTLLLNSLSLSPTVLHEALELATLLNLEQHVNVLVKYANSDDKILGLCMETFTNPKLTGIGAILKEALSKELQEILPNLVSALEEDDSALMFLRFEQILMNYPSLDFQHIIQSLYHHQMKKCIKAKDLNGVKRFASARSQDSSLFVSIELLALAIKTGQDDICEEIIPLVDCETPGTDSPTLQEKLIVLLAEYCRIPIRLLFKLLCLTPGFDNDRYRAVTLDHQLGAVRLFTILLKKSNAAYKMKPSDVWACIQAGNSELSNLLQSLGASPGWMESSSMVDSERPETPTNASLPHENSEANFSETGMFEAFDGPKSFVANIRLVEAKGVESIASESSSLVNVSETRGNLFAKNIDTNGITLLGGKRRYSHDAHLKNRTASTDESVASQNRTGIVPPRKRGLSIYNQESNMIWEAYFKTDRKKMEKLLGSNTSLANFDWMEIQEKSTLLRKPKIENSDAPGQSEEHQLLKNYLQLY